ncbi:MAG: hypothetical protein IKD06_01155 [Clostridia bacterium]|nr:hypothetical protein [Clostridia bacterium]
MSFLLEMLFEIVFEIVVEVILNLYIKLMSLLIPEHRFSSKLRQRVKKGVTAFAALLLLCAFVGFFLFLEPPSATKTVGAYLLFVPLGIMGVQIAAGIVCRLVRAVKGRR